MEAIVDLIAAAVDVGAAVVDASEAEVVDVTRVRADVICPLPNMLRRKVANHGAMIEGVTTIADNSTAASIIGGRKGHVPAVLLLPLKPGKNRFFSPVNRWQSTEASPRLLRFNQSRKASPTKRGRKQKS